MAGVSQVSDIPLTPPSQSFTAPVEDKGTKTGLDFLLQMVNKGANANLNPVVSYYTLRYNFTK